MPKPKDSSDPAPRIDGGQLRTLRRTLLDWYAGAQRDLPWRRSRDPYAIWVSEVMLQQTRVETVIPYWERFLERFPTPRALAGAPEEDVLAAWSGLGYYRRARALHAAAQEIVRSHAGELPTGREAFLALPGVGRYTAGAVLSIAFDQSEPVVDGNVARVFARRFGLTDPVGSPALERELWALATRCVPGPGSGSSAGEARGPGSWNQALMELGATLCTPREPSCDACPWRRACVARSAGRVLELPVPAARPEPIDVSLEVLWIESRGRVLVARRPEGGRMAGLWELPTAEVSDPAGSELLYAHEHLCTAAGAALLAGAELGQVRHSITRHRIRAVVRVGRTRETPPALVGGDDPVVEDVRAAAVWIPRGELASLALTGMAKKILRAPFLPVGTHESPDAG